jgi:hypothetical protein
MYYWDQRIVQTQVQFPILTVSQRQAFLDVKVRVAICVYNSEFAGFEHCRQHVSRSCVMKVVMIYRCLGA